MRSIFIGIFVFTLQVQCAWAQPFPDQAYEYRIPDAIVAPGATHEVRLLLSISSDPELNGTELAGFSVGVCLPSGMPLQSISMGSDLAALQGGAGPDFFEMNPFGADGYAVGCIVSLSGAASIPVSSELEIIVSEHTITASQGDVMTVSPCGTLGTPPIQAVVVPAGSSDSVLPVIVPGVLNVSDGEAFVRGDCNVDGLVQVSDIIFLGERLFTSVDDYPCREACEANGDTAIDIADMITIASYLFGSGAPFPAPFPECAPDPDPDTTWSCDVSSCP